MSGSDMKAQADRMNNPAATAQMGQQASYMLNGARIIKDEGNALVKEQKYKEAASKYTKAIENMTTGPAGMSGGAERDTLMTQCQSNLALCNLKQGQNEECVSVCNEILMRDNKAVKALFRRGQARVALGKHKVAYQDMKYALTLAPSDDALKKEHDKVRTELIKAGHTASSLDDLG